MLSLLKTVKHRITNDKDQKELYYYESDFLERILKRFFIDDLYYINVKKQYSIFFLKEKNVSTV